MTLLVHVWEPFYSDHDIACSCVGALLVQGSVCVCVIMSFLVRVWEPFHRDHDIACSYVGALLVQGSVCVCV